MPTYSYQCTDCGHEFDLFQKITADPEKVCPECKKETLKRLIGAGAGLLFKGSGFYITDYRSKDYKDKAKGDKSGGESKSSATKSDSKDSSNKSSNDKKTA